MERITAENEKLLKGIRIEKYVNENSGFTLGSLLTNLKDSARYSEFKDEDKNIVLHVDKIPRRGEIVFEMKADGFTFHQISLVLEVSRERARQIFTRTTKELYRPGVIEQIREQIKENK